MNTNRNADTANVIIYFADRNMHFTVNNGTLTPMKHSDALKALKHVDVQLTSGNMTTIVKSAGA